MRPIRIALLLVSAIVLVVLQLPTVLAQSSGSSELSPEARNYLNSALDIIQKNSVKRETNWAEFRRLTVEKAGSAKTPADTYPAIRDALKRLGDHHSGLFTPEELKAFGEGKNSGDPGLLVKEGVIVAIYPNGSASRAPVHLKDRVLEINGKPLVNDDYFQMMDAAQKQNPKAVELTLKSGNDEPRKVSLVFAEYDFNLPITGRMVAGNVGLIELPAFGSSLTDPKKAEEMMIRYAEQVQTLIRQFDQNSLIGWIVDLRLNGGGNMWPMLAGIGPILGEGEIGGFVGASETEKWAYKNGQSIEGGNVITKVPAPYVLKNSNLPVAVLTDNFTASSGEAVVVAFRGRNKTEFLGMPTRGLPTANDQFNLSDGAMLNLTVSIDADRTGKTYDSKIPPDIQVKTDWSLYGTDKDTAVEAAVKWIRSQSR
ncbi:MAG TPA: S41 family peptidase [Blastocatellia bacterium]|nr:S41 family peptidase [Blastocatellia bacterium]